MAEDGGGWRSAPEVFHEWALIGKDEGMERGHAASVKAMLENGSSSPKAEFFGN